MCRIYGAKEGEDGASAAGLEQEVWTWRQADADLDRQVMAVLEESGRAGRGGGRPPKDGGDRSWVERYCAILIESGGDREKARTESGCPYKSRTIEEMSETGSSAYDKEVADQIGEA